MCILLVKTKTITSIQFLKKYINKIKYTNFFFLETNTQITISYYIPTQ